MKDKKQVIKIVIAGSRDFDDYDFLLECFDLIYSKRKSKCEFEIVSGTCKGADKLGERLAKERGYKIKRFPANWDKYGKSAGYIRNEEMAKYGDDLLAIWIDNSRGTGHMIDLADKHNMNKYVFIY